MKAPLINLYRQTEDYFFRAISSKCMDLGDGANAYMTGVPVADLNPLYITEKTTAIDMILIAGKSFYEGKDLSFVVIIPRKFCTQEMERILTTMGFPQTGKSVSMAVKLDKRMADSTMDLDDEIIIRANDGQLNEWMIPLIGAFKSTPEISSMYATTHETALKKNVNLRHFSLYKQGVPISSLTLSMRDAIARIDDVGTLPEFQGKGYATHLMRYALSEAKILGAHYCFLESSDSGIGVYQKLGFELLFENNIFMMKA